MVCDGLMRPLPKKARTRDNRRAQIRPNGRRRIKTRPGRQPESRYADAAARVPSRYSIRNRIGSLARWPSPSRLFCLVLFCRQRAWRNKRDSTACRPSGEDSQPGCTPHPNARRTRITHWAANFKTFPMWRTGLLFPLPLLAANIKGILQDPRGKPVSGGRPVAWQSRAPPDSPWGHSQIER